jgi:predicted small lipoprotein YifL
MAMARPALLLALALTLAPACGHKGPPLPPRRHTPPSLFDFRLAQRGDSLELSCTAPSASIEGVAWEEVDIDFFWGEGLIDLEKEGGRRHVRAQPGARVVETAPLPAPGTLVRAASRASAGRDRGQRSLIVALEAQPPLVAPHELEARLRPDGVALAWQGPRPEPVPAPDLSAIAGLRGPVSDRPSSRPGTAKTSDAGPETPGAGARAPTEGPEAEHAESKAEIDAEDVPAPGAEGRPETGGEASEDEATTEEVAEEPTARYHGFRVYRRVDPGIYSLPLNREPQEARHFQDAAAPLGAAYCYVVRAVGSVEPLIESAPSNEVCVDVRDIAPPSPPTGLAVVPRGGGLEVVWSPSSASDLAGYRVYRAVGEGEASRVGEVPAVATAWLDTSTETDLLYRYTVTAFDGAGNESPPSGTAQGRGP